MINTSLAPLPWEFADPSTYNIHNSATKSAIACPLIALPGDILDVELT